MTRLRVNGCSAALPVPVWLTLLLLTVSAILWLSGSGNRDDVIGLLERILSVAALLVVVMVGRGVPLEIAGVLLAFWLPRARADQAPPPIPHRDDVLIPF
ncbi:hypothetical protein [Synechococcus sp. L2F]|uniref:hypothetical protein n=1 Tax=Synechococcus sp. L2F TaxID=2823739 RepID=UPI0020CF05EC|nr:hypothetical protein [Synechococcus sp. L2F]